MKNSTREIRIKEKNLNKDSTADLNLNQVPGEQTFEVAEETNKASLKVGKRRQGKKKRKKKSAKSTPKVPLLNLNPEGLERKRKNEVSPPKNRGGRGSFLRSDNESPNEQRNQEFIPESDQENSWD